MHQRLEEVRIVEVEEQPTDWRDYEVVQCTTFDRYVVVVVKEKPRERAAQTNRD